MIGANSIKQYIEDNFPEFGVNKAQQAARLLYEISKRDKKDFKYILDQQKSESKSFKALKEYLMDIRYPNLSEEEKSKLIIPGLDIDEKNRATLRNKLSIEPSEIFIEDAVLDSALAKRVQNKFPSVKCETIQSLKDHLRDSSYSLSDYNNRSKRFYIVKEKFDFFKTCPCSPGSFSCGYHVVNLGVGCAFECAYCFLPGYVNMPWITMPANIEDFFEQFKQYKKNIRMGSGEFTDSLLFDEITEYSPKIVDFFRDYPQTSFEFKTKSNNIDNLLKVKSAENIIVAWSLNPQKIIDRVEHYTVSLDERFEAALKCVNAGYKIAFHFDPIIYYKGWEDDYRPIVRRIFETFDKGKVEWLSIGALRMTPDLKKIIENRFPDNDILDEEFVMAYDGKLRYPFDVRTKIFEKMKDWIREKDKDVYLYLCMEEKDAFRACGIYPACV